MRFRRLDGLWDSGLVKLVGGKGILQVMMAEIQRCIAREVLERRWIHGPYQEWSGRLLGRGPLVGIQRF